MPINDEVKALFFIIFAAKYESNLQLQLRNYFDLYIVPTLTVLAETCGLLEAIPHMFSILY